MFVDEESDEDSIRIKHVEEAPKRRPKKIKIPRRAPSIVVEPPRVMVMTAGIKPKPIKLNKCLVSPPTLYELTAAIVDKLDYPDPFQWTEITVAQWMEDIGFPQYRECILDNLINGRRLLRFEDPSQLPKINIRDFEDIKVITAAIRKLFATDYVLFKRSIGLPIRKPGTHCTWFKSLTGPVWGVRQNYTRSDILRWMKILMPKPVYRDHWDLVWYQKPDFPKTLLARIRKFEREPLYGIPIYAPPQDFCYEYQMPRKFRIQVNIPEEAQMIWMEHRPGSPSRKDQKTEEEKTKVDKKKLKKHKKKESRLMPKKINLEGLSGKDLILARRLMPKKKFLV
ncbi:uncharacterized protein LOC118281158 [Spodoptera frugiperda]|uniref:Uncharacterized protein LOC118281158 n=1 Tax=Spodoptera frugiperda TaxID=7108 RepID=A0A9R0E0C6_SPOFR|nr:uncharacterized protein LOC118281158 [Spodoptera frugiperda]